MEVQRGEAPLPAAWGCPPQHTGRAGGNNYTPQSEQEVRTRAYRQRANLTRHEHNKRKNSRPHRYRRGQRSPLRRTRGPRSRAQRRRPRESPGAHARWQHLLHRRRNPVLLQGHRRGRPTRARPLAGRARSDGGRLLHRGQVLRGPHARHRGPLRPGDGRHARPAVVPHHEVDVRAGRPLRPVVDAPGVQGGGQVPLLGGAFACRPSEAGRASPTSSSRLPSSAESTSATTTPRCASSRTMPGA